jgi:hypothetical protein
MDLSSLLNRLNLPLIETAVWEKQNVFVEASNNLTYNCGRFSLRCILSENGTVFRLDLL